MQLWCWDYRNENHWLTLKVCTAVGEASKEMVLAPAADAVLNCYRDALEALKKSYQIKLGNWGLEAEKSTSTRERHVWCCWSPWWNVCGRGGSCYHRVYSLWAGLLFLQTLTIHLQQLNILEYLHKYSKTSPYFARYTVSAQVGEFPVGVMYSPLFLYFFFKQ